MIASLLLDAGVIRAPSGGLHENHAAQIFLQWFITEQLGEEASIGHIIAKLKRIKGDGRGLMMIDQELAKRMFVPISKDM